MYTLFNLLTRRGTILVANITTGEVVNAKNVQNGWTPLVAVRVDRRPDRLLLVADVGPEANLKFGSLVLDPPQILATASTTDAGQIALQCVATERYLTAFPEDKFNAISEFAASRIGSLQEFSLEPIPLSSLSAKFVGEIKSFADLLQRPSFGASEIIAILNGAATELTTKKVVSLAGDLFDDNQIGLLAGAILNDEKLVAALQESVDGEYAARVTLPKMRSWILDRTKKDATAKGKVEGFLSGLFHWSRHRGGIKTAANAKAATIGVSRDHFATDHMRNSLSQRVIQNLRSSVAPRRGPAVLATARNEGAYLLEWVAYYRAIGFEEIYLATNNNEDNSDRLLDLLAEHGVIRLTRSVLAKDVHAQDKAYNYHLRAVPEILDHNWILVADVDEFMVVDQKHFKNLHDYLAAMDEKNADSIGINWKTMGSNGNWCWKDELQMIRFPYPSAMLDYRIKSIFRPANVGNCHPHYPIPAPGRSMKFVAADGSPFEPRPNTGGAQSIKSMDEPAVINHYIFRSAEEFLKKFANNRTDQPVSEGISAIALPQSILDNYLRQFFGAPIQYVSPILAHEAATRAEMARLRALPGVAEAEQLTVAGFHERLPKIIEVFANSPQFEAAGELGSRLIEGLRAERNRMAERPTELGRG